VKSLLAAKDTWKQTKLVFDPAVSSSMQQQQTGQIAQALVEYVCPDNADFLLDSMAAKPLEEWPGKLPVAVNIVYDETNETVSRQAEYVRDWLETQDWNKQAPAPTLPKTVIAETSNKYREAFEKITGQILV
jgi:hypothetical protein